MSAIENARAALAAYDAPHASYEHPIRNFEVARALRDLLAHAEGLESQIAALGTACVQHIDRTKTAETRIAEALEVLHNRDEPFPVLTAIDVLSAAHVEATTPTDDEREAITAAIDAILNPFDQGTATQERLVLAAAEKWANRQEPRPITDAMVEVALRVIESRDYAMTSVQEDMRAALEAAEATR